MNDFMEEDWIKPLRDVMAQGVTLDDLTKDMREVYFSDYIAEDLRGRNDWQSRTLRALLSFTVHNDKISLLSVTGAIAGGLAIAAGSVGMLFIAAPAAIMGAIRLYNAARERAEDNFIHDLLDWTLHRRYAHEILSPLQEGLDTQQAPVRACGNAFHARLVKAFQAAQAPQQDTPAPSAPAGGMKP